MKCFNCGESHDRQRTAFCSDYCKCTASMVRAFRKYRAANRLKEHDIMSAMLVQLRFHNAGITYKDLNRELSPEVREAVTARDGYQCPVHGCTDPASQIDHIIDSSDDLANLRRICPAHHLKKTTGDIHVIEDLSADPIYRAAFLKAGLIFESSVEDGELAVRVVADDDGKQSIELVPASGVTVVAAVMEKPKTLRQLYREAYKKLKPAILVRIESSQPLKLCDDYGSWNSDWRKLVKEAA